MKLLNLRLGFLVLFFTLFITNAVNIDTNTAIGYIISIVKDVFEFCDGIIKLININSKRYIKELIVVDIMGNSDEREENIDPDMKDKIRLIKVPYSINDIGSEVLLRMIAIIMDSSTDTSTDAESPVNAHKNMCLYLLFCLSI